MEEEVFQLHVATPTDATCRPMSLYKTRDKLNMVFFPCWCTTGSFSTDLQRGLLSLLLCTRVFSPFLCLNGSSFPVGASQISYLPWQKKKWPLVMKHINWVGNHQMIITAKYGSYHFTGYGENTI